jgi:Tfp pilus assembly protein PilX
VVGYKPQAASCWLKPDLPSVAGAVWANKQSAINRQRGSTLLVALVMLVLLTLLAVSAMNATTSSIQVVGNAQFRTEANAAAQQAVEKIISSNFTAALAASSVAVTIGAASYTAQVEVPTCTSSVSLTYADINLSNPSDKYCVTSMTDGGTDFTLDAASGVVSTKSTACYKQQWDIRATVADVNTGANTAVHQGVIVNVPLGTSCP